jgi:hypothetical protein
MTDSGDRDPAVQELLDKQAIREVTMRYGRAADRADAELMTSAFHPDAEYDNGGQIVAGLLEHMRSSFHSIGSQTIVVDGDTAAAETYSVGQHVLADGQRLRSHTRYLDRFERREGEWRFSYRRVLPEGLEILPAYDGPTLGGESAARRDHTDPSYALFAT